MMPFRKLIPLALALFLCAAWSASALIAQRRAQGALVQATATPDDTTGWDWERYGRRLAGQLAERIEARVREGLPRREFVTDTTGARLTFRFRLDGEGRLKSFYQLKPSHRYLAYLVERTARELPDFPPPPAEFPLFYLDGNLVLELAFQPTGRYKRFYFEEPLDSLLPLEGPVLTWQASTGPLFLYEPTDLDKQKLLDNFKQRIGILEEIKDTSSFTPLDFRGRRVAVTVPFDSLSEDTEQTRWLVAKLEGALESSGATIGTDQYEERRQRMAEAPPDTISSWPADSAAARSDSVATDSATVDSTAIDSAAAAPAPVRDLNQAFASRALEDLLVLAVAVAPCKAGASCRIRLYPMADPTDLKRAIELQLPLTLSGALPDSAGVLLVRRLTTPPERPKPPEPPKPAAAAPAAVPPAGDTTRAATAAAPGDTIAATATPAPAASDSIAATAAPAPADSSGAAPQTAPPAAPADSAATGQPAPGNTAPPAADSTAPAAPPADQTPAPGQTAPADSSSGQQPPGGTTP